LNFLPLPQGQRSLRPGRTMREFYFSNAPIRIAPSAAPAVPECQT
jgi:hypothetical protein